MRAGVAASRRRTSRHRHPTPHARQPYESSCSCAPLGRLPRTIGTTPDPPMPATLRVIMETVNQDVSGLKPLRLALCVMGEAPTDGSGAGILTTRGMRTTARRQLLHE